MKGSPDLNGQSPSPTWRTTLVAPRSVGDNLALLALRKGVTKNQLILLAVRRLLESEGLQPDKRPRISKVEY